MKDCYGCGKKHNSDIIFKNGWPVCSKQCKSDLEERLEKWLG